MGKEFGAWVSRHLWGGGNTSPLQTTAWEATSVTKLIFFRREAKVSSEKWRKKKKEKKEIPNNAISI